MRRLLPLAALVLLLPLAASGYKLRKDVFVDQVHGSRIVDPRVHAPPFLHWDLREFPGCGVPYTINAAGTPDIGGDTEFEGVDSAAAAWSNASPSVIDLFRAPETTDADTWGMDGENVVLWDGDLEKNTDLWPPRDDAYVGDAELGGSLEDRRSAEVRGKKLNGRAIDFGADHMPNSHGVGDDIAIGPDDASRLREEGIFVSPGVYAGPNAVVDTEPNNGRVFGITCSFTKDFDSQVLMETDIVLNDRDIDWNSGMMGEIAPGNPFRMDVWSIVVHELGHLVGLHHVSPRRDANDPIMTSMRAGEARLPAQRRHLRDDDRDGVDFLYTPDLGDAKDPLMAVTGRYPSLVRDGNGRVLNGVSLLQPASGAAHLYNLLTRGATQFEYLGTGVTEECGSQQVDADSADDGVYFRGGRSFTAGKAKRLDLTIAYSAAEKRYNTRFCEGGERDGKPCGEDKKCPEGTCPPEGTDDSLVYLNAWCDWNGDGDWQDQVQGVDEKIIDEPGLDPPEIADSAPEDMWEQAPGAREGGKIRKTFEVVPPGMLANDFYCRFRVDYGEDVGDVENVNGDLDEARGVAQFGEVEDYRMRTLRRGASLTIPPSDVNFCASPAPGQDDACRVRLQSLGGAAHPIGINEVTLELLFDPSILTVNDFAIHDTALVSEASSEIDNAEGFASVTASLPPRTPEVGCNNVVVDEPIDFALIEYTVSPEAEIGDVPEFRVNARLASAVPDETETFCEVQSFEELELATDVRQTRVRVTSADVVPPELGVSLSELDTLPQEITIDVADARSGPDPASLAVVADRDVFGTLPLTTAGAAELGTVPAGTDLSPNFQFDASRSAFTLRRPLEFPAGENVLRVMVGDRAGNVAEESVELVLAPAPGAPLPAAAVLLALAALRGRRTGGRRASRERARPSRRGRARAPRAEGRGYP